MHWVRVYDNNYPDETWHYLAIDTASDTWRYDSGNQYLGTATSHELGIVPVSRFAEPPSGWVPQASAPWSSTATTSNTTLWLLGRGHLLVSDSQGRQIGYVGEQFVNNIPGASASVTIGGLGVSNEPVYALPVTESYEILLDGQTLTGPRTSTLTMFGRGFAAVASEVPVTWRPGDTIVVAPDGTGISYRPANLKL